MKFVEIACQGIYVKRLIKFPALLLASSLAAEQVFACAFVAQDGTRCNREASFGSEYCWQHGGSKRRVRVGVDERGKEQYMARLSSQESNDLAVEVFNQVKESLVLIKGNDGKGSGFAVEADGKKWIYTNEHVARIGHPLKAVFIDGTEIAFSGTIEVARNVDLARIEITGDIPLLKIRDDTPSVDELAFVFGNSAGGDVVTKIIGVVLGVGDKLIEVDAKFVRGNSGSPILDGKGRVVGVATFATLRCDPADWTKADTRFNTVRRFGVRINNISWEPVEWKAYAKASKACADFEVYRDFLIPVCFKNKKLVTDYDAKSITGITSVRTLRASLRKLVKQDKEYLKALDEFDTILEKRKTTQPGQMGYPKIESVNIRYKKLKRELLESILERKNALRMATKALETIKWPCKRLEEDANHLCEGFRYCCTAYDQLNEDALSQISWRPE